MAVLVRMVLLTVSILLGFFTVSVRGEGTPSLDEWASFADTLECAESEVITVNDTDFLAQNNRNYYMPFDGERISVGIIYCGCEQDVVRAVQFARHYQAEYEVPFSIRSGGHSGGAFSRCEGCIIIDLYRMKEQEFFINADKENSVMIALEPGNTIGELVRGVSASNFTNVTIPHGLCEGVGFGGLAQGGGFGLQMRKYGLTVDYIVGVRVVDCEGNIVQIIDEDYENDVLFVNNSHSLSLTSSSTDEDMADWLWAIRGAGGGSFGIVTKFYFKTITMPPSILMFKVVYPVLSQQNVTHFLELYRWYFSAENDIPDSISIYVIFGKDFSFNAQAFPYGYKVNVNGLCHDDNVDVCYDLLYEFLNYTEMDYLDEYTVITSSLSYEQIMLDEFFPELPAQDARSMGYQRARLINDEADFSDSMVAAVAASYWAHITNTSNAMNWLILMLGSMRGNIPSMDIDFARTSFEGRNAWSYITVLTATPPAFGPDAIYRTVSFWETQILSALSDVQYVNNVDDATYNITELYPTRSNYARLREVKTKFDADDCFNWKWSVPPFEISTTMHDVDTTEEVDSTSSIYFWGSFVISFLSVFSFA